MKLLIFVSYLYIYLFEIWHDKLYIVQMIKKKKSSTSSISGDYARKLY